MTFKKAQMTLEEIGTPWAEHYGGSGRPTGRLAEEPTYQANGDVAPGWGWVGSLTEAEFYADFEEQEHDQCHIPATADWYREVARARGNTKFVKIYNRAILCKERDARRNQ